MNRSGALVGLCLLASATIKLSALVLQITTRFASRKRLNVCHNMNIRIELVFVGDHDIHIDMSLCLKFVLQEFDMIWLFNIDKQCLEF